METLIEIKNLSVEYKIEKDILQKPKTVFAVNDLTLNINKGEILAIAGESGCGKSTLGKAVLKLIQSKSGDVYFNQSGDKSNVLKESKKDLKKFRQYAQIIFQNPYSSLNPKMKIYDILKEPLIVNKEITNLSADGRAVKDLTKGEVDKIIIDTVEQVGLSPSVLGLYPHEFSGGQRQRIAIARIKRKIQPYIFVYLP